jgi:hypothetical protein
MLSVILPGGAITEPSSPDASHFWFYGIYNLRPGTGLGYSSACDVPNMSVAAVLAGTFAIRPAADIEIVRAGGEPQVVPAGEEVVLHAGDGFLYHNTVGDDYAGFRNGGQQMLTVVEWDWVEAGCQTADLGGMDITESSTYSVDPLPFDPTQPIAVHLRRLSLPPGAELGEGGNEGLLPAGTPGLEVVGVASGRMAVVYLRPNDAGTPVAGSPVRLPLVSTVDVPAGIQRVLRNIGRDELVVAVLTITNAGEQGSATPAA